MERRDRTSTVALLRADPFGQTDLPGIEPSGPPDQEVPSDGDVHRRAAAVVLANDFGALGCSVASSTVSAWFTRRSLRPGSCRTAVGCRCAVVPRRGQRRPRPGRESDTSGRVGHSHVLAREPIRNRLSGAGRSQGETGPSAANALGRSDPSGASSSGATTTAHSLRTDGMSPKTCSGTSGIGIGTYAFARMAETPS